MYHYIQNKMPTKIKRLLATSVCALSLVIIPISAEAAAVGLPCTPTQGSGTANNTDLFTCVNSLYKYGLVISSIAAVLMIIFAGYMYIFSGGSESKVSTAKAWITSSLLGIAVLLTGFLLLKQINPSLLTIKNISPQQIAQQDWFEDADIGADNAPPGPIPGGVTVPTGTAQDLAKQILNTSNIYFLPDRDVRSSPKQNIIDTSNGLPATTSARSDVGVRQVPLDAKMLAGILAVSQVSNITVNYIVGGDHSGNSRHYRGKGFDVHASSGDVAKNKAMLDACRAAGATELIGPPGTGYATNPGHNTHIHCGWP